LPFLESRFEERLPRDAGDIAHHVVVYRFGPAVETLLQRLRAGNVPALVVEIDETAARAGLESGQRVVFVRSDEDALDVCRLGAVGGLRRCELRIAPGSAASGRTLGELGVGARSGAVVVGQWSRSRLSARCTSSTRVEPGAILELVGSGEALEQACKILGVSP